MRPMNNYANKYAVALAAMKQANAIDVTKWLLCIANTLAVPVVAIAAGAAEVMRKPFDLESLHIVLHRYLSPQPQTHGIAQT